jgi:hypothetical protein
MMMRLAQSWLVFLVPFPSPVGRINGRRPTRFDTPN